MRQLTVAIVLVLVALTATANQHTEMKADPVRQLEPLAGTWQCKGTAFQTPWFPEHATSAEVVQKWMFDGKWLTFTYSEKKTAENPMPFNAAGNFGYDPESKMFVYSGVDSTGGYSSGTSQGWVGDVLTFEGPWHLGGMTATSRDTFTRKSANEIVHLGELQSNGSWMKLDQETCTRK
jgi:hypothetical protein